MRVCLPAAAANLGSVDAWAQLGTAQISLGRARCEQDYFIRCQALLHSDKWFHVPHVCVACPSASLASLSAWQCDMEVTCPSRVCKPGICLHILPSALAVCHGMQPRHACCSCAWYENGGCCWWASMTELLPAHCRWETPDGSIFSVADGRRLAQEPVRLPTAFEAARQRKIDRATLGTPLVRRHCAQSPACICEQPTLRRDNVAM